MSLAGPSPKLFAVSVLVFFPSAVFAQPRPTEEAVQLDPFVVSQATTKGYAATSSLSATRVNTPVREIPAPRSTS